MIGKQIINILNKDKKAKEILSSFNEACENQKLTQLEMDKSRETLMMMLITRNPEAMEVMARDTYLSFQ
ncbi:hypothetical protein [Paenibacillus sp. FSL H3-0286]|uniref:hypothetical protein n=1 Tax=Paenibacillus sp. FSL H3-0286 TaxID=2921427 RepID=UPI003247F373